ncbi:MAG TPA: acyl-CoA dehydrogenase [Acidimicrobiales bacterium]|nr:acyl-CoA dehydrogenase [Acidimicrobiales bacterium]
MAYAPPLRDIQFTLDHLIDYAALAKLPAFAHADRETVETLLADYGRFVAEVIGPLDRTGDTVGCRWDPATATVTTPPGFTDAYRRYVEAGWGSVPFAPEHGGGGFPWVVALCMQELLTSANLAFSLCPLLTQGAIDLLSVFGSPEQQQRYLPCLVSGEWTATMNLTEPQAGSDVGALRTRATPVGDGTWRVSGTKIFITYGEHDFVPNIVHLVLARVPDAPPGTRGISCFIVPKFLADGTRNGVRCLRIEEKMGIHASPTCVMEYEDAVGYLIGEANAGMRYMFTMMNNARLSVGMQGLAVSEAAYQQAVAYAMERRQGRAVGAPAGEASPIVEHPDVRRMLLTMRSTIEAMRGLLYLNAWAIDMERQGADDAARAAGRELADLLTPVSKAWCTDMGMDLSRIATQVHGGMGYIEETGVAQHERDVRIAAIYEGTNGIQAVDLVARKLPMRGGRAMLDLLDHVAGTELPDGLADVRTALVDAVDAAREATEWLLAHGASDPNDALAAATPYLRLVGTTLGGWVMARQAAAAQSGAATDGYAAAKLATARFYCRELLPQAQGLLAAVTAGAGPLMSVPVPDLASR